MGISISRRKPALKKKSAAKASRDFEAISATVPVAIAREARARHTKRDFSAFVARALERELVREAQDAYLAGAEQNRAIDMKAYEEFTELLNS